MAWDVPGLQGSDGKGRGAFLLAGVGTGGLENFEEFGSATAEPPIVISYSDGSRLKYFPRQAGEQLVAVLQIPGIDCSCQVAADDSRQLRTFVGTLRRVTAA